MWLKQSTQVVVSFGPFLDKTDGVTLETGLVSALDHATTGIMLSKNGGALAVRNPTVTATTYDAHGCYRVTLDTTDTGTLDPDALAADAVTEIQSGLATAAALSTVDDFLDTEIAAILADT